MSKHNQYYEVGADKMIKDGPLCMVHPKKEWPEREGAWPASALKMGTHFSQHVVKEEDRRRFYDYIDNMKLDVPEGELHRRLTKMYSDMLEAKSIMKKRDSKKFNEGEVRFTMGNHVVTVICTLTGVRLSIEDTIKSGEMNPTTTEAYELVSGKCVEDFALWVSDTSFVKVFILEMKKDSTANVTAVCQTVGYYMASQTGSVTADGNKIPALGMVLSQHNAWLVFFPYCCPDDSNSPCVNAVVGGKYLWTDDDDSPLHFLIAFVVKYIQGVSKCKPILEASFELVPKHIHFNNVVSVKEAVEDQTVVVALERLEQAERKAKEEKRKAEEEKRKAKEEKRKAEEEKRKAEEVEAKMDEIIEAYATISSAPLPQIYRMFSLAPPKK